MINEKELYDRGNCMGMTGCGGCPFSDTPLEEEVGDDVGKADCYDVFRNYYEKKEVLDYVLKGDSNE